MMFFGASAFVVLSSCKGDKVVEEAAEIPDTSLVGRAFHTTGMVEDSANARTLKGHEFLAENESKPGIKTRRSGLQIMVLEHGDGPMPTLNDTVITHYKVSSIEGVEFDNSDDYGGAQEFRVDKVIAGWREALQGMKVGARWKLFVPPELAYGDRGMAQIPGGETLVYDLQLLGIAEKEDAAKHLPGPQALDPSPELSNTRVAEPGAAPGLGNVSLENLDLLD